LSTIILFNLGIITDKKERFADYTEYLGKNYYESYDFSKKKMFSSYVANHSCPADIWVLFVTFWTEMSFVAAKFVRSIPMAGWCSSILQTLYVDRGKGGASAIEAIEHRQKIVQEEGNIPPLCIFAEGTT
jgi:hypothetical protein